MRVRVLPAALAVLAAVLVMASCREPTQITLEITTDLPCATVLANGGVGIRVGSPASVETDSAQQVEATTCINGRIGSLVVVPSGAVDDQVAIFVAEGATSQTATCSRQSSKGCILARRVLRYVPHTSLKLPIELTASCVDKPCTPGETCNKGQCQSDAVGCDGNGLCNVPPPADAGIVDTGAPDAPCSGSQSLCGSACVDLAADLAHCGACNVVCGGECQAGICRLLTPLVMPDEPTTVGCLAVTGTPPEVFWTMRRTQAGTSAVYDVSRDGGAAVAIQSAIVDLGGIAGGNGRVVYGVNTSGIAALHDYQVAGHAFNANVASVISGGHVQNVAVSPGTPERACWTTLGDGMVRCSGWGTSLFTQAINPGEAAALGPSVVSVGLANAIFPVDAVTGSPASWGEPAPIRGVAARADSNVFYYTTGQNLKVLTAPTVPSLAATTLDTLANPGLGVAYDPLTEAVYWVEQDSSTATSIHSRPLAPNGKQRVLVTGQLGANCIAVDDQAVYWLSNGVPHKMPK